MTEFVDADHEGLEPVSFPQEKGPEKQKKIRSDKAAVGICIVPLGPPHLCVLLARSLTDQYRRNGDQRQIEPSVSSWELASKGTRAYEAQQQDTSYLNGIPYKFHNQSLYFLIRAL